MPRVRPAERAHTRETMIYVSAGDGGRAAGRDLIENQIVQNLYQPSDFHEPDLEPVAASAFDSPQVTGELLDALIRHRLVLLGGSRFEDKETLARHLAWVLRKHQSKVPDASELDVKEGFCGIGALDLNRELERTSRPTLILLQRAEVRHVGFSLETVQKRVVVGRHFLVITTDAGKESWIHGRGALSDGVWWELTAREVYSVDYLANELRRRLLEVDHDRGRPAGVFPDGPPDGFESGLDRALVQGLSLREVAGRLDSPEDVRLLVEWILGAAAPVGAEAVLARVEELQGEETAVESWYRLREPQHQLLTAGLLFFDGLFDDQLFGALDVAVAAAWRHREPVLASFDYQDIEALDTYFRRSATAAGGVRIESRSEAQADALYRAVWRFHRRQIVSLLPVVSMLVREAGARAWRERRRKGGGEAEFKRAAQPRQPDAARDERRGARRAAGASPALEEGKRVVEAGARTGRSDEPEAAASVSRWEKYGPAREIMSSAERRQRLCEVISRSLGRIGLLSVHVVERCLLELAQDGSWEAQEVAAQALASWRGGPGETQLYRILREWYDDAARLETELWRRIQRWPDTPWEYEHDHTRATVSMAVFDVALDEAPDRLAAPIVELLRKLIHDQSDGVRLRFRQAALPAVVALHMRQLDDLVWDLVRYDDLIQPVAVGWGLAYALRPEVASALVEEWRLRCLAQPPVAPSAVASPREARLATVALTYGYIDYDRPGLALTPVAAIGRLEGLLSEEHPFVLRHVLVSVGRLVVHQLARIEQRLPALLEHVPLEARPALVSELVAAYRIERRELTGGQAMIEVGGGRYAVWLGDDRPPTPMERALEAWLCDRDHPAAQQVAFAALAGCAGCDIDVEEARWRHHVLSAHTAAEPGRRRQRGWQPGTPKPTVRRGSVSVRLLFWLLTVGREELRSGMVHVVAELPGALQRFAWAVGKLLFDWRRRPDELGTMGRYLSQLAKAYRRRLILAIVLGIFGVLVAVWVRRIFGGGG